MQPITFTADDIDPPAAAPVTFTDADISADFQTSNEKDAAGNAVVSGLSKAWSLLNTPLLPQIADAAHAIATQLDVPRLDYHLDQPFRAALAGAFGAAGDLAAGFTSPLGIALTLAGVGPEGAAAKASPALKTLLELPQVRTLQRATQGLGGAAFGAHGAERVVMAPTVPEKLQGVAEIAAGALGTASAIRGAPTPPTPRLTGADAAANAFAAERWIPLDAATATGSPTLRAVQKRVAHTLGGEPAAVSLIRAQQQGLTRVGADLAADARGAAVAPEQAGQGTREALAAKRQAHTDLADRSYERLRELEAEPTNRTMVPLPPEAVDKLPGHLVGQLRRIVHEMDASGYSPGKLVKDREGSGSTYSRGSGGAKVYQDITQELGSTPPRSAVQAELEAFLGGGKETPAVTAALEVAKARYMGRTQHLSTPELPVSAMHDPTRLEKTRTTGVEMGLPVDLTAAKTALQPVYDQMRRQMPLTQQQASTGLKALQNILDGPDLAPLSQVDKDLSAIKAIAREQTGVAQGLAKFAADKLDRAVKQAAANGSPEVSQMLERGRQATIAKVQTETLIDALPGGKLEEGGAVFKRATAPHDGGIEFLRAVKEQTPHVLPQIARAKLEELLELATERERFDHADRLFSEWQKLGRETKRALFPQPGQTQQLDHFFLLAKRLAENPNPSGTAHVSKALDLLESIGTWPLAKILYSPRGVRAVSRLMNRPATSAATVQTAAQTAGWAEVVAAARDVGVRLPAPAFATSESPAEQK